MKMSCIVLAAAFSAVQSQSADLEAVLAKVRANVQAADYHLVGHVVRVDADGNRVSTSIAIKAHWFPDGLRIFADIGQPPNSQRDLRTHILIEMRPNGHTAIRIAHPGDAAPSTLAFEKWKDSPLAAGFSFEDLLEAQYFWQNQSLGEPAKYGARDCDVLRSTPGDSDRTHYSLVTTWLDQHIGFPVYAEKTLKHSGTVKEFTFIGLSQNGGVWFAHQVEVKVRGQSGSSLMIIDRGTPKANLKPEDFSPEQLTHF